MVEFVPISLVAREVRYYSPGDEQAFFAWLRRMPCVGEPRGVGIDLHIPLRQRPTDGELRELIGLFFRYKIDMRQLAALATDENRSWFARPDSYWRRKVFS